MELRTETIQVEGFQQVVYAEHAPSGMRAIVAIHNTNLGPACGGLRLLDYSSKEEALHDVLRLARGMSYKSALAGIGFGGGKSVLIANPKSKTPAMLHAFGRFVESLDGKYIAAKDMNIGVEDLAEVRKHTRFVLGAPGQSGSSGDPSPLTAIGVYHSLVAVVEHLHPERAMGDRALKGVRVALQGLGAVGYDLASRLHKAGAQLWVTDINPEAVAKACRELGAQAVEPDAIYDVECDIYAPCARGATLNTQTIPRLKCRAIVGCANNQLETERDGLALVERGVLYAPDFAVNAGGIINVFLEHSGYDPQKAVRLAERIGDTTREILARSAQTGQPPFVVAEQVANERMGGSSR